MNWRADAQCLGTDPELFAPQDSHSGTDWDQLELTATLYCRPCPVRDECRAFADSNNLTGLYGGVYKHSRHSRIQVRTLVYADGRKPRLPARGAA
jgi:hypothetical protein